MRLETGIQLHLPSYESYSLRRLIEFSRTAVDDGVDQIWVTDNLWCRNIFVVLAAVAASTQAKLGTAIMGQYFRSPVAAATSLLSISELMEGRELSVGLGTGNPSTHESIRVPRPVTFMEETARCLGRLLRGERIVAADYPVLCEYFRFNPTASFQLPADAAGPIPLYQGGNGPRGLAMAGELMDGFIFGWQLIPAATVGRIAPMIAEVDAGAARAGKPPVTKIGEVKIAVTRDGVSGREFVRDHAAPIRHASEVRRTFGYSDDELSMLGIDPAVVDTIDAERASGKKPPQLVSLVTEGMIDAFYIAGDPGYCREKLQDLINVVTELGFTQLMFSELGPDPIESCRLLTDEVLPYVA